jgi:cell division protein FtsN
LARNLRRVVVAAACVGTIALSPTATAWGTTTTHPVVTKTSVAATPVVTHTYAVLAGTYKTQARADARLATLTGKSITGFSVVASGTGKRARFRVEDTGMSRTDARKLVKALKGKHITATIIVTG